MKLESVTPVEPFGVGIVAVALFACSGGSGGTSMTSTSIPTTNAPAASTPAASVPAASTPVALQAKQVLGYFAGSSDSMGFATASATPITAVSMWALGDEDASFWRAITAAIN